MMSPSSSAMPDWWGTTSASTLVFYARTASMSKRSVTTRSRWRGSRCRMVPEFGLERLAQRFEISHDDPHRALSDALAARDLFLMLLERFEGMPRQVLSRIASLAPGNRWSVSELTANLVAAGVGKARSVDVSGIDEGELRTKLKLPARVPMSLEEDDAKTDAEFSEHIVPNPVGFLAGRLRRGVAAGVRGPSRTTGHGSLGRTRHRREEQTHRRSRNGHRQIARISPPIRTPNRHQRWNRRHLDQHD